MSEQLSFLHCMHMPTSALSAQPQAWKDAAMGMISFSAISGQSTTQIPSLEVPAPILEGANAACEVWFGEAPLRQGHQGNIRYRHNDEMLFGVIELMEAAATPDGTPLQQATESAYRQIFALLDDLGYPFMYRFWNYMADINGVSHELERYRQFNVGRQNAFLACEREVAGQLPAACALGFAQGPLLIAFLAGRTPARAIENPRQMSAFEYPEQYGPRSPTFSRANLLLQPGAEILLISGTASIVGHETRHLADVAAQTQESLANIAALIAEANRLLGKNAFDKVRLLYRVYARQAADMSLIRQEMLRILGADMQAIFIQADICRTDLLLEIEATAMTADCGPDLQ
jgi:chorismate lyase/3-hydroxybenzoate synthase